MSHILATNEKNFLMIVFDMTNYNSFQVFLKRALKDLIFAIENLTDEEKVIKAIPLLIVGTKYDNEDKVKVSQSEIDKLLDVLRRHIKCEFRKFTVRQLDDAKNIVKSMF